jgi:type II secretory pathway component GspD/PulD (secretin)
LRPKTITSIIADGQDNSLLVQGDAEGIQELRQIIQLLDIPAKQVQIKAEFITASVTQVDQFGINFQLVPAPNISTAFTGSTVTGSTVVEFSQGNLVAELQAQLSTDASKVVSAPLLTATNNTLASISFSEEIPYNTSSTAVNGSGTATTSSSVGFLYVQSGFSITPQINGDNSVTMDLTLPNTTTNPSSDTSLPPTTTTQFIHTVRTVANGETMVLGGLVSKNDSNARVYVPFLGNLPIIGSLFRTRNLNNADTELLIFVTPTGLPYPGQYDTPTPAVDTGVGAVTP